MQGHGGELALAALTPFGVQEMFTLSGGHVFPLYDAAVKQDVRIVDVRHEQTATFAAEGMAKLTRRPGVAVLTAGPGVTNGIIGGDHGDVQRLTAGRARRPGPAGPLGRRLAAGVRPRPGAGADHQAGDDGDGRRQDGRGDPPTSPAWP